MVIKLRTKVFIVNRNGLEEKTVMLSVISLTRGDVVLSQLSVFLNEEGRSKEESATPHGHKGAQQE